eukprot:12910120-Prorocentrum_lima.AAC.1
MTKRNDLEALASCNQTGARINIFAHIAGPKCAPAGTARRIEDYVLPPQSFVPPWTCLQQQRQWNPRRELSWRLR